MVHRRRRFTLLFTGPLALAAVLCTHAITRGAAKPEDLPPEIRYKTQIEDSADFARRMREATNSLEAEYLAFIPFLKPDLTKHRELCDAQAMIWDKVSAAYRTGDVEEVRRLRTEIEASERARVIWKTRITELRLRQARAAPRESDYVEEARWIVPTVHVAFDALVDAKRASSEAWGRAAEAMFPGADPVAVNNAREEAFAMEAERDIAQWRADWALQRERMQSDKTISSAELTKALDRIQQVRANREQFRREEAQRERRGRELETEMRASERDFREAYEAANAEKHQKKPVKR